MNFDDIRKNILVNAREELSYVALQHPAGLCIVLAHLIGERPESGKRFVGSLLDPAGKGIRYELPVEIGAKNTVDGMMEKAIPNARLVDVPRLRVGDIEGLIAAVLVCAIHETAVER